MYSEARIQLGLWHWLYGRGQRWIVPNACEIFATGECDVLSIMKSGLSCEYEIKISRKDFRADAKKGKYEKFERRLEGETTFDRHWGIGNKHVKQIDLHVPNHFSYVVPSGMITAAEVPHYAGLIYTDPVCRYFEVVKKPVKIHADIYPDLKTKIGQKLMFRYWHQMQKAEKAVI